MGGWRGFPFEILFFLVFWGKFPLFFLLFSLLLLGQGQTTANYWKHGELHSNPICTDPAQNLGVGCKFGSAWSLSRFSCVQLNDKKGIGTARPTEQGASGTRPD